MRREIIVDGYKIYPETIQYLPEQNLVELFRRIWRDPSLLLKIGLKEPNLEGAVTELKRERALLSRRQWTQSQWNRVGHLLFSEVEDVALDRMEEELRRLNENNQDTGRIDLFLSRTLLAVRHEQEARRENTVFL